MQGSFIQNVFDDMFKRFRSRSDTAAICDEKKKEICDIDQNAPTQSPKENDNSTEVIEVCDSEDDCSNGNDDVVFLRQTTSKSAKCGDNWSKCGAVDEIIVETPSNCERERRLSGESVRPSKTKQKVTGGKNSVKGSSRIAERSSDKPKPKKRINKQYLTYRTRKKNTKRIKSNLEEKSKTTRTKTKSKAQKSVAHAKKVLTKSLSASKKSTTEKRKCDKSKGKRTQSSKSKRTTTAVEGSSVKTKAKRKKISTRSKKNVADSLITNDVENYEKDRDIGTTKRFFDVLDEVLKDDCDHSFGMLSFLHPPVPEACMASSLSHPITQLSENNSFFRPCLHKGNTIIKEN